MPERKPEYRFFNILLASSAFIFIVFIGGGRWFMENSLCFRLFGCNAGFFGYDALFHFSAGVAEAALILRLNQSPRFGMLPDNFWKRFFVVLGLLALFAFGWEMLELTHDRIVHISGFLSRLPFFFANNPIFQPSRTDTLGDMAFSIMGGALMVLCVRNVRARS